MIDVSFLILSLFKHSVLLKKSSKKTKSVTFTHARFTRYLESSTAILFYNIIIFK